MGDYIFVTLLNSIAPTNSQITINYSIVSAIPIPINFYLVRYLGAYSSSYVTRQGGDTVTTVTVTNSGLTGSYDDTGIEPNTLYTYMFYSENGVSLLDYESASPAYTSDTSCFNEGTKILCLNKNLEEEYIAVENLRKGDFVKSYKHGYRRIDLIGKNNMINNPNKFTDCMFKMVKTDENNLIEDLIVTGGHSILVDDLGEYKEESEKIFIKLQTIDDKYLLLAGISKDFIKLEDTNVYTTYYHFILENNGNDDERFGVWANGVLTETPSKRYFTHNNYIII
jgi:hypothetical protein